MIGKIKVTTDTFDNFPEFTELWNQWLKTPDGAIYEAGYGDFESLWRAERGRTWVYRKMIERLTRHAKMLLSYAECQKAWDAATAWRDDRPSYKPTFLAHGWDGKESPTTFLYRIRDEAIALAPQGPPSAAEAEGVAS